MSYQEDLLFGKSVISQGLIDSKQLANCLKLQKQYQRNGQSIRLPQLMVQQGYIEAYIAEQFLSQSSDHNIVEQTPESTMVTAATVAPREPESKLNGTWNEINKYTSPKKQDKQLGRYQIIEEIGRGGMGCVYRAFDPKLKRTVALKVLIAEDNQQDTERFKREAKATAELQHPNIVRLHDIGYEDNRNFFTMDFIEGQSLQDMAKNSTLSVRHVANIMFKVAKAIHYAHTKKIIHRDIKPANIMMTEDGEPKIMDFGLAKVTKVDDQLSVSGMIMGTMYYMPPEQAQGKLSEIDNRSDVYALGAVLYELLTGRPPFTGSTLPRIVEQIVKKDPTPPSKIKRNVPEAIEKICLKALAKKKERRYATASAMALDLKSFIQKKQVRRSFSATLFQAGEKIRKNPMLVVIALVVAAITAIFLSEAPSGPQQIDLQAHAVNKQQKSQNNFIAGEEVGVALKLALPKNISTTAKTIACYGEGIQQTTIIKEKMPRVYEKYIPLQIIDLQKTHFQVFVQVKWDQKIYRKQVSFTIEKETLTQELERLKEKSLPYLLHEIISKNHLTKKAALILLQQKTADISVLPELTKALKGENKLLKQFATVYLRKMGEKGIPTLKHLQKNIDDANYAVRYTTVDTLEQYQQQPGVIEALVNKLRDRDKVLFRTMEVVARIGSRAVPALVKGLKDKDYQFQLICIGLFERMGKPAFAATSHLIPFLDNTNLEIQRAAIRALGKIGSEAEESVPHLVKKLAAKDLTTSQNAAWSLGEIGSKKAIPDLIKYIDEKNDKLTGYVLQALGKLKAEQAVPILIKGIDSKSKIIVYESIRALGAVGPIGNKAATRLLAAFKDSATYSSREVAIALGNIEAVEAIADLHKRYKDKDAAIRQEVIIALGKLLAAYAKNPEEKTINEREIKIVSDLIVIAEKDKIVEVRKAAQQALERVPKLHNEMLKRLVSLETMEQQAIEKNDGETMVKIAYIYREARDAIQKNDKKAFSWFKKAAALNHPEGNFMVGYSYRYGRGVKKDHKKAIPWYQKGADLKHARSAYLMGYIYKYAQGVKKDYKIALPWLKKGAEWGYRDSMYHYGLMHLEALGTPQNDIEASKWFLLGAEAEHFDSLRETNQYVWNTYKKEIERPVNERQLKILIESPVTKNTYLDTVAAYCAWKGQHKRAQLLAPKAEEYTPKRVELLISGKSPKTVESFMGQYKLNTLQKRAIDNNPDILYQIARMYQRGNEIPQDNELSFQWYTRASLNKSKGAKEKQVEISRIINKFSKKELTESKKISGLIAYYPFNFGAKDISGNNYHGFIRGVGTIKTKRRGKAYHFNGYGDHIALPININPKLYPKLTMGAWVRPSKLDGIRQVLSHDDGNFDRGIGIHSGSWCAFSGKQAELCVKAKKDKWTFIVVVYTPKKFHLYINGKVYTRNTKNGESVNKLIIGSNPGWGEYFAGDIDEVFVYGKALTRKQIMRIRSRGIRVK